MGVRSEHVVDIATIETGVKRIISEELGVEIQSISPDTDIIGDLDAHQADLDTIKTAAEYKFHIRISDENWKRMKCVRDIVHLVDVYLEIKQIEM
ncbi:MAG: phosphopantetheine-binding protein [Rhodospirillaceae bacterium]